MWFMDSMRTNKEEIGMRIRQVRKMLGLEQFDLGEKIGASKQTVSGYEKGRSYPSYDFLTNLAVLAGISLDWIITGHESVVIPSIATPKKPKGEIAATIEPGRHDQLNRPTFANRPPVHGANLGQTNPAAMPVEDLIDESFSMSEMVTMTIEVLESKTVYRSALASNVRAFHQAVKMEGEMKGVKEEVQQMRAEHRTEMEELKEMIRSLGGALPQKRESAASS